MVSTRSSTKPTADKKPTVSKANVSKKRKSTTISSPPNKKLKQTKLDTSESKESIKKPPTSSPKSEKSPIIINRAPVLHLWGASVTHHAYPKLSWSTCLSAGAAVSAICAVSKGRAIGKIEPKDSSKKNKTADDVDFNDEIEVMQFHLNIKDGKAYMGAKAESDSEDGLRKKFGDRYEDVKKCFENVLKGKSVDDVRERGFHMYEDFRPTVKSGTGGWGRKGELDLEKVKIVVAED